MATRGRPRHPDILTPREWEVLTLLRQGLSNPQIAERLGIGRDAAKYHVSEILGKLGLSSREEAAAWRPEVRPWWAAGLAPLAWPFRWLSLSTAAKVAGAATLVAAAGGVGVLTWALIATGGPGGEGLAPGGGSPAPAGASLGKIAFAREGNIWAKDLDSGQERGLAQVGTAHTPRFSADGRWVAFAVGSEVGGTGGVQLWTVREEGGEPVSIAAPVISWQWSPAADRLAYVVLDGGLWVVNADGSDARQVVTDGAQVLAWSQDGSRLAVERWLYVETGTDFRPVQDQGIWLVYPDGSGLWELFSEWQGSETNMSVVGYLMGWSPDGRYIAFLKGPNSDSLLADGAPLYLVSTTNGAQVKVSDWTLRHEPFVDWPARGVQLAYVEGGGRATTSGKQVVAVRLGGSGRRAVLSTDAQAAINPSWAPDGLRVAYVAGPAGQPSGDVDRAALRARRIWAAAPDGSGALQLTDDPAYSDDRPLWSADGSHILFARMKADQIGGQDPAAAELWLMAADGSDQRMVVGDLAVSWFGYYGFIDWSETFDWYGS